MPSADCTSPRSRPFFDRRIGAGFNVPREFGRPTVEQAAGQDVLRWRHGRRMIELRRLCRRNRSYTPDHDLLDRVGQMGVDQAVARMEDPVSKAGPVTLADGSPGHLAVITDKRDGFTTSQVHAIRDDSVVFLGAAGIDGTREYANAVDIVMGLRTKQGRWTITEHDFVCAIVAVAAVAIAAYLMLRP